MLPVSAGCNCAVSDNHQQNPFSWNKHFIDCSSIFIGCSLVSNNDRRIMFVELDRSAALFHRLQTAKYNCTRNFRSVSNQWAYLCVGMASILQTSFAFARVLRVCSTINALSKSSWNRSRSRSRFFIALALAIGLGRRLGRFSAESFFLVGAPTARR